MTSNWIKSKRNAMRAILPATSVRNDRLLSGSMLEQHSVIEKTTGRTIVQVTINGTESGNTASISVHPMHDQFSLYGYGRATGFGCHLASAALQAAIASAGISLVGDLHNQAVGIDLFGDPYNKAVGKVDWNKAISIAGRGHRAMTDALLAIAYAAGARSVVVV